MLQTVNPPYDFEKTDPFRDLPPFTTGAPHRRKILPSKKTAAIAIFAASSQLIKELVAIDPVFFETDRIEFGRRRDQSRWINFVELSNSTRWSEIESTVRSLLSRIDPNAESVVELLQNTIANLFSTDRIKGKTAVDLREQLRALRPFLSENDQAQLEQCLYAVDRDEHFRQAKEVFDVALPLFLFVTPSMLGYPPQETEDFSVEETSAALVEFLINRQKDGGQGGTASSKQGLHAVNRDLPTDKSELNRHIGEEQPSHILEGSLPHLAVPVAETPPVRRIGTLLSSLASLHKKLHGYEPIFLIDISGMELESVEQADLLRLLLHYSSRWQLFVIPDNPFLALCEGILSDEEEGHQPVTVIDLSGVVV